MKTLYAIIFIAANSITTWTSGQNLPNPSATASCPQAAEINPLHLYGLWRADFEGLTQSATLLFEKHPELSGSVSGGVNRNGVKALIAGDVDHGEFTLEESQDGQRIAATWLGTVVENSCGKEIRGTWSNASNATTYPFLLRKLPGWQ